MDYYDELQMKLRFYNNSHDVKANKVVLGWKVIEYFQHLISVATGEADFYGAEIKLKMENMELKVHVKNVEKYIIKNIEKNIKITMKNMVNNIMKIIKNI